MKKIIVAIDSFKGCLTSAEANGAACKGIMSCCPDVEVVQIPVSDGGEGWIEAFHPFIGGELVEADVHDPLMRPIKACYINLKSERLAVIEIAKASGLNLLKPEERNPLKASSYGTGELIVDAIRKGCRRFSIGLGGSATSDAGMGMLQAFAEALESNQFTEDDLKEMTFSIATDVTNPLSGPMGAAHVFGPQKGATPEMVEELDKRAIDFAKYSARKMDYDCSENPGAGAAGGLGYAFMQYLHADRRSGIDVLLDMVDFDAMLKDTDLIITGEGSSDAQTLMGKLPMGIMRRAQQQGVDIALIAGRIADKEALLKAGFKQVVCINPEGLPLTEAMKPQVAKANICETVRLLLENSLSLQP